MQRRFPLMVLALITLAATTARAQEADVRAAMEGMLVAWNTGDFAQLADSYHPDTRGYFLDGGILLRGFNAAALQAAHAAGFRASFTARNVDINVYGNVAVSVAFLDGELTLPGAPPESGSWRYTETRLLEDGVWRIVQYHFSKLDARFRQ